MLFNTLFLSFDTPTALIFANLYTILMRFILGRSMLKIYGIKNCNSMKKAFDLLNELGLAYEFHDYKKLGIDAETVKTWLDQIGAEVVLNKKGTTWKKLSAEEQKLALSSEEKIIETLTTHNSMIKRPVLDTSKGYIVGFDEAAYKALK